jgi:acetyl-CoA carboxylase biotin carboxyl carrier protein
MELTHEDVLNILELLERSDVEYLELEAGGTKLVADKNGTGPARSAPAAPSSPPSPGVAEPVPAGRAAPEIAVAGNAAETATRPAQGNDESALVTVTAPVVGVFYRSPEPGAPPFTEVGALVAEDTTVGLVEVMKMFNGVTAGVHGRVVEIFPANADFVEYGQPLMTISPEPVA